jgi:hypothetical protein
MNYGVAVTVLIPVIAIGVFCFLAQTMLAASRFPEDKKGRAHGDPLKSLNPKQPLTHSDCYDDCMNTRHGDSARIRACRSACGL